MIDLWIFVALISVFVIGTIVAMILAKRADDRLNNRLLAELEQRRRAEELKMFEAKLRGEVYIPQPEGRS